MWYRYYEKGGNCQGVIGVSENVYICRMVKGLPKGDYGELS